MLNVKDNKTMMYTDLAVEIQEECSGRQGEIPGVVLERSKEDGEGIACHKNTNPNGRWSKTHGAAHRKLHDT